MGLHEAMFYMHTKCLKTGTECVRQTRYRDTAVMKQMWQVLWAWGFYMKGECRGQRGAPGRGCGWRRVAGGGLEPLSGKERGEKTLALLHFWRPVKR